MLFPKSRITNIAGKSKDHIRRPLRISLKIIYVTAITIGMKMGGEYQIHACLIEDRHEGLPFFREALLTGRPRGIGEAVLERILVHQDHFPFLFRLQDILFRPDLFFFVEIRYPFLFFIERCIEYREMNIAPVKRVVVIRKRAVSILRHVEM